MVDGALAEQAASAEQADRNTLRVMTLNLAHGRSDGFHQAFLSDTDITENLDRVATIFDREAPDVVACQEADGPSVWSGDFDHVEYLADRADFGWRIRGEHVGGMGLSYGTALLSRRELRDPGVHTFEQSSATPPKGFSVSTVELDGQLVDVASVHLDFASDTNRYKQIKQLVEVVSRRDRPVVLMGDFNTDWNAWPFQYMTEQLGLSAYRPAAQDLATFGSLKRLDWVLVSPELEFTRYEVLPDVVSDHKGVVVDVRFKGGGADDRMLADAKEVE